MAKKLNTTGELRETLAAALGQQLNGELPPDEAKSLIRNAIQINEQIDAEVKEMKVKSENRPERKQIGVKLDVELWREVKALAIMQGTTGGELLEKAMREYLERHRG